MKVFQTCAGTQKMMDHPAEVGNHVVMTKVPVAAPDWPPWPAD